MTEISRLVHLTVIIRNKRASFASRNRFIEETLFSGFSFVNRSDDDAGNPFPFIST